MSDHVKPGELLGKWEVIIDYQDDNTLLYQNNGIHRLLILCGGRTIDTITPNYNYSLGKMSEYFTEVWFDPPIPNGEIATITLKGLS